MNRTKINPFLCFFSIRFTNIQWRKKNAAANHPFSSSKKHKNESASLNLSNHYRNGLQNAHIRSNLQHQSMDDEDDDILGETCSETEDDEIDRQTNTSNQTQLSLIDHLAIKTEKRPKRDQLTQNNSNGSNFQATTNSIQSQQNTSSNVHSSQLINSNNHSQSISNNTVSSLQPNSTSNSQSLAHQHFAAAAAAKFAQDLSGLTTAQQHLQTAFGLQSTTANNILNHNNNSFVHSLANNSLNGQSLNGHLDPYIHEHVQQQQTLQHLQHLHSLPLAHPHPAFLAALQKH